MRLAGLIKSLSYVHVNNVEDNFRFMTLVCIALRSWFEVVAVGGWDNGTLLMQHAIKTNYIYILPWQLLNTIVYYEHISF